MVIGEAGADFVPELQPEPSDTVLRKPGKGAFHATGLDALLHAKGITHLLIGGVTTEVCVQTTMREANDRGYECLLVQDCAASYFPHFHDAVVEMVVAQGGIVGWAAPLSAVQAALTGGVMNGLGGLNKSPQGVVVGLVQLQLPVVDTPAQLRPRPNASPGWWARRGATWARWTWWSSPSTRCTA